MTAAWQTPDGLQRKSLSLSTRQGVEWEDD